MKRKKRLLIKAKLEKNSDFEEELDPEMLLLRDLTMREFLIGKKAAKHMINFLRER